MKIRLMNRPTYKLTATAGRERCGRVINTPATYSGGPGFKSQTGDQLS
jgi:hypothetical protein